MKYTKENHDNYCLHMFSTKKFKKVDVSLFLSDNNSGKASYRSLLNNVLGQSSKKYNSKRKLASIIEEHYSPFIDFSYERIANVYLNRFTISYYDKKYIKEDLQESIASLLYELVYNPDVETNSFDERAFSLVKEKNIEIYKIRMENNREIALDEFYKIFDKEGLLAENPMGNLEELKEITAKSLYDYYQSFIKNAKVDIFVIGDIDEKETSSIISKYFSKIKSAKSFDFSLMNYKKEVVKEVVSSKQALQNISIIGYKYHDLNKYENQVVTKIYDSIFGGDIFSRLFSTVREKNSLCYSISSRSSSFDNNIFAFTSYSKENYQKIIDMIKDIQENFVGDINSEELDKAKASLLASLKRAQNSSVMIAKIKFNETYLGMYPLEEYEKKIMNVSTEDLVSLQSKIKLDTIYTLGGK